MCTVTFALDSTEIQPSLPPWSAMLYNRSTTNPNQEIMFENTSAPETKEIWRLEMWQSTGIQETGGKKMDWGHRYNNLF